MTTPSSGPITASEIDKVLFYQTPTTKFSLNDSAGRTLTGNVTGTISYHDFYNRSNSITTVYDITSSGSFYTYTVPNQCSNLTIKSLTVSGNTSSTLTVVPGQTLFVSIGGFGQASYIKDGSNNILYNSPAYSYQVISFSGAVDGYLQLYVTVANPVGGSYSFSGANNGVITAAAGAYDILYTAAQGYHGDLGATVTLSPALLSTLVNTWQVATTSWTGSNRGPRALYSEYTLGSPYTVGDGYVVEMSQGDSIPDEGTYSWTIAVQQIVPITIIANA